MQSNPTNHAVTLPQLTEISNSAELRPYGIESLTGESCAYGFRMLCDVNEDGARLVQAFLGDTVHIIRGQSWNRNVNGKPAVGSIMLSRNMVQDLAFYCLAQQGYPIIAVTSTTVIGIRDAQDEAAVRQAYRDVRRVHHGITPEDRNMHQFSGRLTTTP